MTSSDTPAMPTPAPPDAAAGRGPVSPVLSIIVVSYNTRELTLACLRSVYEQTRQTPFELIVVDNASDDGSAAAIAAEFPHVRFLPQTKNLGFAAANNLAAELAAGEWLLLLNPDTVVLDAAIDRLVAFASERQRQDPRAGIFGGRTLFPDGSLNPTSCWMAPTPWSAFCIASGLTSMFRGSNLFNPEAMPRWRRDSVRQVDIVTGCFFLLRRSLWNELSGFDPAFFMYGEEADLCLRAKKRGVVGMICPQAAIIHYGGASERVRAEKLVRLLKAKSQLYRRHMNQASARISVAMLKLWTLSRLLAFSVANLRNAEYHVWRGVWRRRSEWSSLNYCRVNSRESLVS